MERVRRAVKAPLIDDFLGYLYAPLERATKVIRAPRAGFRLPKPNHILLPEGYVAEVVATGFHEPVHCTFDDQGFCYVSECGHKIEAKPRIVKVDVNTGDQEVFFELPDERWIKTGAFTGACWHDGYLYFTNSDALSRITPSGEVEDVATGLPGLGDHQTNYPVVGPDGKIYFPVGSATNTGVVGADNYAYEWLKYYKDFHDVPGEDVALAGRNYEFQDVLGSLTDTVSSGAYVPFGEETAPGRVIQGEVKCNGSVMRCNPDGSDLELVAWGLRNPYGIAFHPDGRVFVTEHGIDERGARFIIGDYDDFYEIRRGAWYGWPDFASGIRLDDPRWGDGGRGREPVLAQFPDPDPPKPFATFEPHAGSNGVDFCRDPSFGFEGDAFVALFGDLPPVTTRRPVPAGFKVVRVDMETGEVRDFAVNRIAGPSSKLPHGGFDRPSHCQFGPDGALYVVDFGEIQIAPEVGGIRIRRGTGVLWRIRRTGGKRGDHPPQPIIAPIYAIRAVLLAAAAAGGVAALARLRRPRRSRAGSSASRDT